MNVHCWFLKTVHFLVCLFVCVQSKSCPECEAPCTKKDVIFLSVRKVAFKEKFPASDKPVNTEQKSDKTDVILPQTEKVDRKKKIKKTDKVENE